MLRLVSTYFGFSNGGDTRDRSTSWLAFRNPAFRWYFAGSVTSDLGTWLANTAQLLLTYRLSHSVLVIGLIICAQFSSPLLLGPWAGVMTDRLGGRRMLFATQLLGATFAIAMASLVFTGLISPWWLAGGAIGSGLAFTLALPARNVTVRCLVREQDVEPAFAMDSVSYNLGRAVGPPVTMALVMLSGRLGGYGWAFTANAVSFLLFAVFLLLPGKGSPEPVRTRGHGTPGRPGFTASLNGLKAGLATARADWTIAVLLAMVAAVTVADDPVLVLGPALARQPQMLDGLPAWLSPATLPGLFIAALGAGTVLGSLRPSRHKAGLRVPAVALALLAACMVVFVCSPWWPLSVLAAAGAGFTCLAANSSTRTLLSKRAGPHEASVMVVWAIAWAGSKPLASLSDGVLADSVGLRWTGVILALPALIPILVLVALLIRIHVTSGRDLRPTGTGQAASASRPQAGITAHRKIAVPPGRTSVTLDWVRSMFQDANRRALELLDAPGGAHPEPSPDNTQPQPAVSG